MRDLGHPAGFGWPCLLGATGGGYALIEAARAEMPLISAARASA